jgi:hypothetical protein
MMFEMAGTKVVVNGEVVSSQVVLTVESFEMTFSACRRVVRRVIEAFLCPE